MLNEAEITHVYKSSNEQVQYKCLITQHVMPHCYVYNKYEIKSMFVWHVKS